MPGPFPGMDPWLEDPARWTGVHQAMITYLRDAMQPQLAPKYVATIGERVYVATAARSIYPDVMLVEQRVREAVAEYGVAEPPVATPVVITLPSEPLRVPYIEIVQAASGDVVTIIELISPANKAPGDGREQYLRKRLEILRSPANLVEIDLLGDGQRANADLRGVLERLPPHRYLITVSRAADRDRIELYPIRLDERLPRFRVPVREPDPDVILDVQAALDRCYDNGRFGALIDYARPAGVALSDDEAAFARARPPAR